MFRSIFILAIIVSMVAVVSASQITVSGSIATNTTWDVDTVNVTDNVTIEDNIKLTINPGAHIIFQDHYKLNVQGCLIAIGLVNSPIIFTAQDTTTGWYGIRFDETPVTNEASQFSYCYLMHGVANGSGDNACGGALFIKSFSNIVMTNSQISKNRASGLYSSGAGIYCKDASPVFRDVLINNNSGAWYGGGLYCENASPTLLRVDFRDNSVDYGGGIYCKDNSQPELTSVDIQQNLAPQGAGIYCKNSYPKIRYSKIRDNGIIAGGTGGGGILCTANANLEVIGSFIEGNNAADGGGILLQTNCTADIYNSVIAGNSSGNTGCGICLLNFSTVNLVNSTLTFNRGYTLSGAGIFCNYSNINMTNSIMWYNASSGILSSLFIADTLSDVNISYSDIEGGIAGFAGAGADSNYIGIYTDNIGLNPLFTDTLSSDYSLPVISPCVNMGTPDTAGLNLPLVDIIGEARISEDRIDIGAYEYIDPSSIDDIENLPEGYYLSQNYPNPFNPTTTIKYASPVNGHMSLVIYDVLGRKVKTLVNDFKSAGVYTIQWDGTNIAGQQVSSGPYYYQLKTSDGFQKTMKMMILK